MADAGKVIIIPAGAAVKYYNTPEQFNRLKAGFAADRRPHYVGLDIRTMRPVLVDTSAGETKPVYYTSAPAYTDLILPSLLDVEEPPATIRADSSIAVDKDYVKPGEKITVTVFLTRQVRSCRVKAVHRETGRQIYLDFPDPLAEGNTRAEWTLETGALPGIYELFLTGYQDNVKIELKSVYLIHVLSDQVIRLGQIDLPGRKGFDLVTERVYSEEAYGDNAGKIAARRKLIMAALRSGRWHSHAMVDFPEAGAADRGRLRLLGMNACLSLGQLNAGGTAVIKPPAYEELSELRRVNMFIDRLITHEGIELILQDNTYKMAHIAGNTPLTASDLREYAAFRSIKRYAMSYESLRDQYDHLFMAQPTLTNYIYIKSMLSLNGFTYSEGSYLGKIAFKLYPASFRQGFAWIVLEPADAAIFPAEIINDLKDMGKNEIRIVAPLLTSAAVTREGAGFEMYVDIPDLLLTGGATPESIIESRIYADVPLNAELPFLETVYEPRKPVELSVQATRVSTNEYERFYKGTAQIANYTNTISALNEQNPYIGNGPGGPREVNPSYIPPDRHAFMLRMYYRKYPGLLDECQNLYRVQAKMKTAAPAGLYLLKVRDGRDHRVHPLRVFESGKEQVRFAHLTDIHTAKRYDEAYAFLPNEEARRRYVNPNHTFKQYAQSIKDYDFAVVTGDLTEYANDHRPYDDNFVMDGNWKHLEKLIRENFKIPVFMCPGNHDYKHNPTPLSAFTSDCNLTKKEADFYPEDRKGSSYLGDYPPWAVNRCLEDLFFCDENALQYYYYNFCPFYDYSFSMKDLAFVFLDSKADENMFLSDYKGDLKKALAYLRSVLAGTNPPPMSRGLGASQIDYLNAVMEKNTLVFMHSALINPNLSCPDLVLHEKNLSRVAEWGNPYIPNEIELKEIVKKVNKKLDAIAGEGPLLGSFTAAKAATPAMFKGILDRQARYDTNLAKRDNFEDMYFNESSILNRRGPLLGLMYGWGDKKVKMVLVGHVHKNLELKLKTATAGPAQGTGRWFCGEYSKGKLEDVPYIISTVSSGPLGYKWEEKPDSKLDPADPSRYFRRYYGTGYREICITTAGVVQSMKVIEDHAEKVI